MIKISIVIPVYNTEKYLDECLDSICRQNFDNLQIICVNDCSTDNSYSILKRYKKQYNFIEVYCNTSNKGLAYTRNRGIGYAKGEYIMFVDSDDYVASEILSELYDEIKNKCADVMLFDVKEIGDSIHSGDKRIRKNIYADSTGIQLFSELVKHNEMFAGVWSGIYKREFLEQIGLHFIEGILHEDIPYIFAALIKAQQASYFSKVAYYYRQRENSILHKPDYEKLALGLLIGYAEILTIWQQYEAKNSDLDKYNIYVSKYVKSVIRLLNSRCNHLLNKKKINQSILKLFLDNFVINVKADIADYFSLDNVERMKKRGHISIYGAGETAAGIIPLLRDLGIQIDKIYVTDTSENKDFLLGVPIVEFEQIPFHDDQHCIVIAAVDKNKKQIKELLNRKRYCGYILMI